MNWYEDGYRRCPCFWGSEPGSLVRELPTFLDLTGRRVLDLGAGEGKNAYFCGAHGAEVVAIELSDTAIRHGKRHFGESERVTWIRADALDYRFDAGAFDVIISYGLTHCLPSADAITDLVCRMQIGVPVGGFNVVCAFNARYHELDRAHPGLKPTLVAHAVYAEMYSTWRLHKCTDTDLRESHPSNGIWHTHSMTRLIAERQ